MEQISNRRLFQTMGPVKEKDLSPKVFLFVVGTRSAKLSENELKKDWRKMKLKEVRRKKFSSLISSIP